MDYTILEESETRLLEDSVNKHIGWGYKPIGGVSYSQHKSDLQLWDRYTQAMILKD